MFNIILFIVSDGILFFVSFNASRRLLPNFTSNNVFLNSWDSSELTFITVISKAFSKSLPDSSVNVSISKNVKASLSNFFVLF